ncbi:hypothetical protein C8R46DRAFT_988232 [Mycena filopes]|nr:hypothetical protein C8R46DRAFT_988232 [Mycena filopes]
MSSHPSTESTHSPPTQSERDSLAADRARFAVIRAQISELERSLCFLYEESSLLKDRLDAYTYPVLSLPTEIVSEIFVHFLPIYPKTPPMIGRSSPNALGQICRKWREIALTTPALWRAISVPLQHETRLAQKLHLLKTSLNRSESCPLSITMHYGGHVDPQGILDPFFQEIAAHSVRWECLRLHVPGHPLLSIEAPHSLRAVQIAENRNIPESAVGVAGSVDFHEAPLLHDITIVFWGAHCMSRYPWSQLTAFTAHSISPHECVDVLSQAFNLVHCYIFACGSDAGHIPRSSRAVTLHHLETLTFHGAFGRLSWRLLDFFVLPALQKLQTEEKILQRVAPVDDLASLVSRSKCRLQELWVVEAAKPHHRYDLALPTVSSIVFAAAVDVHWPFGMSNIGEDSD